MFNWSGVHQLSSTSKDIVCPQDENEVVELILKANKEKCIVRPVGRCLSFEPINRICDETHPALLLDLKEMSGLVESQTTPTSITVYAGTTIDYIIEVLRDKFTPPREIDCSPGVIGLQTIVGAISTGTHGQGLWQSSIADSVIGIRFVDATGEIHQIKRPEPNPMKQNPKNLNKENFSGIADCDLDDCFGAFVTSLGLLSVIIEVTLRTRPLRLVTVNKYSLHESEFREKFVDLNRKYEFVKAWWFPDTSLVHIWEVEVNTNLSSEKDANATEASPKIDTSLNSSVLQMENEMKQDTISKSDAKTLSHNGNDRNDLPDLIKSSEPDNASEPAGICKYSFCKDLQHTVDIKISAPVSDKDISKNPQTPTACKGRQFETVRRFANAISRSTGSLSEIFCKGIPVPQVNCEIGIPLESFPAALDDLAAWWKKQTQTGGKKLHYPFIFRCTGASESWLSASYARDTCWIGFLVYLDDKGGIVDNGMEVVREIQMILATHDGIPHLGKHFRQDIFKLSSVMPKWKDFMRLRSKMDPNSIFVNKWAETFLRES